MNSESSMPYASVSNLLTVVHARVATPSSAASVMLNTDYVEMSVLLACRLAQVKVQVVRTLVQPIATVSPKVA